MDNAQKVSAELSIAGQIPQKQLEEATVGNSQKALFKRLRGGFFLVVGYLLSPLCWWNDLFFNLPIAGFFGYICSWLSPKLLLPGSIVGYWLSNIVGILLMQIGTVEVFQGQPKERNFKKELLAGFASSTIFTLVILGLIQLKILDTPNLFPGS